MDYLILLMAVQWFVCFLKLFFKVLVQREKERVDSSCKELLIDSEMLAAEHRCKYSLSQLCRLSLFVGCLGISDSAEYKSRAGESCLQLPNENDGL